LLAPSDIYDIAIIGGGINGAGIARDAAGRGWRVLLCEAKDFGSGTSSASTKLIHGGLRYLEYYQFRLVREALMERERLWAIAPHIIWPLRFVLPWQPGLRPAWLLRLGLFLYDHIGGRRKLPATRGLDLRRDEAGAVLAPGFTKGFEYSDCWVEDSRLVVLNAMAAAGLGATILPRTSCLAADQADGLWRVTLRDEARGENFSIQARALVNAAGPWVSAVAHGALHNNARTPVRLVQGSHIVLPKLYEHDRCYIFQNGDGRIIFLIPYEQDYTLIGTTDRDFSGDPAQVQASDEEVAYLCAAASEYLATPITPEMVVWRYAGVRPLFDESSDSAAQAATRDYVLKLEQRDSGPALLSIYGGKITTYRRLAESALAQLAPLLPKPTGRRPGWTAHEALPGGGFAPQGFGALQRDAGKRYPFLAESHLRRLLRAYGMNAFEILAGAESLADLGEIFGADLTEAELAYLVRAEFVRQADDALWRRSKLGLRLSAAQKAAVERAVARLVAEREAVG